MCGVCANDCINNIMINRNASCYVSIIYAKKWLLRSSSLPVCVCNVRYISKYCVLSVFYSCRYTIAPLLRLSSFVCAHSYIFQLFNIASTNTHPRCPPRYPLPLFPCEASGAAHLQNFFIFLFFKSHDTINSQYSNRFIEFFHIIILWSLIF